MHIANWKALLIVVALLPIAALADQSADTLTGDATLTPALLPTDGLQADLMRRPSWQIAYPDFAPNHASRWHQPLADFEFREGSALMRISKLRSLSLLTLAKFGKSRLFLGVNDDGFVGLHFNALSSGVDERYLEILRMPYIDEATGDSR